MTPEQIELRRAVVAWVNEHGPETTQCVNHSFAVRSAVPRLYRAGWTIWTKCVSGALHAAVKAREIAVSGTGGNGDPFVWGPKDGARRALPPDDPEPQPEAESVWVSPQSAEAEVFYARVFAANPLDRRGKASRSFNGGVEVPRSWLLEACIRRVCSVRPRGGQLWLYPGSRDDAARATCESLDGAPRAALVVVLDGHDPESCPGLIYDQSDQLWKCAKGKAF